MYSMYCMYRGSSVQGRVKCEFGLGRTRKDGVRGMCGIYTLMGFSLLPQDTLIHRLLMGIVYDVVIYT